MNDVENGAKCTLSKFASDAKEGWVAYTPSDFADIQRDLNKLENWTKSSFMQLNRVLHVGRHNSHVTYTIVMAK